MGLLASAGAALLAPCLTASAACALPPGAPTAHVTYVIDGDTVVLGDGRHVRLIGIDAPEIAHDGAADKPFARAAKDELRRLLAASGWRVEMVPGRERLDRHDRTLANLYDRTGANLSEQLLRLGLAYQATIPPNDRFRDCYAAAEADARTRGRGLWGLPPVDAAALAPGTEGFTRVVGRVRQVRTGRRTTWINLAGPLKLRITGEDLGRFDPATLASLPGARVEVLGWIYRYRGKPHIRVRDPSALRRIESTTK